MRSAGQREFACDAHAGDENENENEIEIEIEIEKKLDECFQRVKASGIFGRFKDFVFRHKDDGIIYTMMAGRIEYRWLGVDGKPNQQVSPFKITLPLLKFNLEGSEEGFPEATERPFKSTTLSLDRRKYRVALPKTWDDQILQSSSFGFVLSAPKSSHHVFELVVQLRDGSEVRSLPVDLSYFVHASRRHPVGDGWSSHLEKIRNRNAAGEERTLVEDSDLDHAARSPTRALVEQKIAE